MTRPSIPALQEALKILLTAGKEAAVLLATIAEDKEVGYRSNVLARLGRERLSTALGQAAQLLSASTADPNDPRDNALRTLISESQAKKRKTSE